MKSLGTTAIDPPEQEWMPRSYCQGRCNLGFRSQYTQVSRFTSGIPIQPKYRITSSPDVAVEMEEVATTVHGGFPPPPNHLRGVVGHT